MSSDDNDDVIMKAIINDGASDYLVKPIQRNTPRLMWKHGVRKRNNELKEMNQLRIVEDGTNQSITHQL